MTRGTDRESQAQQFHGVAVQVALRTGLLRQCAVHGEVYDPGQHDYQGACMVATYLVNRSDPLVALFLGDRVPLTNLLRTVCDGYGKGCSKCAEESPPDSPSGI